MVALGGTFDPIHDGHRALFERAFSRGTVTVGLTSDALAEQTRRIDRDIRPYTSRLQALTRELQHYATESNRVFEIIKLQNPTAIADEPRFDVLVVSPETAPVGEQINEMRTAHELDPLDIDIVDHVLAEDGDIISSTRIAKGEIDEHGNLLSET